MTMPAPLLPEEHVTVEMDMTDTTLTQDDLAVMGTLEEAQVKFLEKYAEWCKYQGAFIATAGGHKRREARAREAEIRFVQAAAVLAWHMTQATLEAEAR